jgi:DNA-binding GntR family transcriptional regulator
MIGERREERSTTLAERAYDHVRGEMLRGRLPVGNVVAEGSVADELGISKTPGGRRCSHCGATACSRSGGS